MRAIFEHIFNSTVLCDVKDFILCGPKIGSAMLPHFSRYIRAKIPSGSIFITQCIKLLLKIVIMRNIYIFLAQYTSSRNVRAARLLTRGAILSETELGRYRVVPCEPTTEGRSYLGVELKSTLIVIRKK